MPPIYALWLWTAALCLLMSFVSCVDIWLGSMAHRNATRLKDILLLNLNRRPERLAEVTNQLNKAGLNFTRFPAIDGHFIRNKQYANLVVHPDTKFSFTRWGSQPHPQSDYGTVGCWQSHLQAYYQMVERVEKMGEVDSPIMILEDDVYLKPNATALINEGAASLPADWEIFFVGFKNDYCFYPVSPFLCRGSMLLDAHAYILRNASVAKKLIEYSNKDSPQVADIYWIALFKDVLKIYLLRPYEVIRQNKHFGTDIQIPEPTASPVLSPADAASVKQAAPLPPHHLPPPSPSPPSPSPSSPSPSPTSPPPPSPPSPPAKGAPLPASGPLTLAHLSSLQVLLSSSAAEASLGLANKRADGTPAYDYTNILKFFLEKFASNAMERYDAGRPVLAFDMDLHSSQLGNRLGNFFEAFSFAQLHGLHFVAFSAYNHQQLSAQQHQQVESYLPLNHAFVAALPTVMLHPSPVESRAHVAALLNSSLGQEIMEPWPWQKRNSSWLHNVESISTVMRAAATAYMADTYGTGVTPTAPVETFHHPKEHMHNHHHAHTSGHRKLIPDVVILFRCSNVVLHGGNEYGFINFNSYPKLIKTPPREIYILSEPLKYGPWTETCVNVTRGLITFLSPLYPNTTILVRRGFAFDGLLTLALAQTVICPPSTFCFWPALANPSDNVHVSVSPLINLGQAPHLRDTFHWIAEPKVMGFWKQTKYDLQWPNATEYLLDKLTSTNPPLGVDGDFVYRHRRRHSR